MPVIVDLGFQDFTVACRRQEEICAEVAAGLAPETLLLMEHPPVYTVGSGGDPANLLDPAVPLHRVSRGGDVTCHGPGQLVCYPILDLGKRGRDLHRYLRMLEELLVAMLQQFGVRGYAVPGRTGVWTDRGKIAAIGIGVRRWVSWHGFALNVANDLELFRRINPCGIVQCPVTSLVCEGAATVTMTEVKAQVARLFPPLLDRRLPRMARVEPLTLSDLPCPDRRFM